MPCPVPRTRSFPVGSMTVVKETSAAVTAGDQVRPPSVDRIAASRAGKGGRSDSEGASTNTSRSAPSASSTSWWNCVSVSAPYARDGDDHVSPPSVVRATYVSLVRASRLGLGLVYWTHTAYAVPGALGSARTVSLSNETSGLPPLAATTTG